MRDGTDPVLGRASVFASVFDVYRADVHVWYDAAVNSDVLTNDEPNREQLTNHQFYGSIGGIPYELKKIFFLIIL